MSKNRRRLSQQERWEVWETYNGDESAKGPCAACGRTIHFRDMIVGHNVALDTGGQDTIANMRPLCWRCDQGMGTDSIDDYRARLHGPATEKPAQETLIPQVSVDFGFADFGGFAGFRFGRAEPVGPTLKLKSRFALDILEPECVVRGLSITTQPFHQGATGTWAGCGQKFCRKHSQSTGAAVRGGSRLCQSCWNDKIRLSHPGATGRIMNNFRER